MKNFSVVEVTEKDFENLHENPLLAYYKKISKYPTLSNEEERRLAMLAASGDNSAKTKLIQANLRLVVNIAKKSG